MQPGYWEVMSDHGERPRLEINWIQSAGGALAAVSSALLLSTFGAAGTLIGAAVGSLVITVGGALYSYSIRATRQRVATAQTITAARIGLVQARARAASAEGAEGTQRAAADTAEELAAAEVDRDRAGAEPGGESVERSERLSSRGVLGGLPWKRIVVSATTVFVVAMLMILAFELLAGRAVSSYTGGSDPDRRTSIPGIGGGGDDAPEQPEEQQPETPDGEEEVPPEDEPDEIEPTVEPTEPVPSEPTPSDPTLEPVPAPTQVPTTEPSPTP